MVVFQYCVLTIQVKGQWWFWCHLGVWQTFYYWAMASWSLKLGFCNNKKWRLEIFFWENKVAHFCEWLEECQIWYLRDQNWVSNGYFSFLPIAAICYLMFLGDIFWREVVKTQDVFWKKVITICLTIGVSLSGKCFGPFWCHSFDLQP